ncbi:MAG: phosphoribosyltransferase family protein [Lachnospiraceae bacterium]|nr:phosphoribosyltransferase family protein [Lachnospiraceae bacterium]
MMYTEQDLVRIAKRENNNKRKYLVVNRFQGKHIPVKPHEALAMFRALADTLKGKYDKETLLVIGFAETATAIGAAVAAELGADYMQTTREAVPAVEYLYFSEEHSHATEQKLVKDDIDRVIDTIDRIVFVEDEVTTGKTILNIINILRKQYSEKIKFSVASILNGMNETALATYQEQGIELLWLVKTNHTAYTEIAESYKGDGSYIICKNDTTVMTQTKNKILQKDVSDKKAVESEEVNSPMICCINQIKMNRHMDTRRIVNSIEYAKYCELLYQEIVNQIDLGGTQNMLVLGTEEYMYPALFVAGKFEEKRKDVRFHATTRSPIAVSTEEDYPFHTRYELKSLYDSKRTTYVYDLQTYDTVVILTDAKGDIAEGICSLVNALKLCGNRHIVFVN